MIFKILWNLQIFKIAAPIPPMLKYSIEHNFLDSFPVLIKFVSKFMVCKPLYLKHNML